MNRIISIFVSVAAFVSFGIDSNTMHDDIPGTATIGEIVAAGGGGGGGGGVDTNAVKDIIHETVSGAARPLPKYLHELDFADSYTNDAAWYYEMADGLGGCSAVRNGGFLYRNFDFPFDDRAEFVVKMAAGAGRFASVGVAQVGTNLTEQMVTSGKWSRYYKCLPGSTVDGINEKGVAACINVVCTNGSPWETERDGRDINAIGAVRWVLDHAVTAEGAAYELAGRVYIPDSMKRMGYSCHFALVDADSTWLVEDGIAYECPTNTPRVMTNFRLRSEDPYGTGYERFDILVGGGNITNAWFREAYRRPFTRPTEFASAELGITHTMTNALLAWAEANIPQGAPESLTRNGRSWQTVHTSVYDISNRVLRVAVQEVDDWYAFQVPSAGGGGGGVDPGEVKEIVAPMIGNATNALGVALRKEIEDAPKPLTSIAWNRDGYWTIDYRTQRTSHSNVVVSVVTNANDMVIDTVAATVVNATASKLTARLVDPLSPPDVLDVGFACLTDGASIDDDDVLVAASGGVYRVMGTDAKSVRRYINVLVPQVEVKSSTNETYVGDAGLRGETVAFAMTNGLDFAVSNGTVAVGGKEIQHWGFPRIQAIVPEGLKCAAEAAGNVRLFAIGTKCLASAWHYAVKVQGAVVIGGVTVTRGAWVNAKTWALANGFSEAEVSAMGSWFGDIALVPLTQGELPESYLPYFMSDDTMARLKTLRGLVGWAYVQSWADPIPVVFDGNDAGAVTIANEMSTIRGLARCDVSCKLSSLGFYSPVRSGDSGHPAFLVDPRNGRCCIMSHFTTGGGGPSYMLARRVIKAFNDSIGSTILED